MKFGRNIYGLTGTLGNEDTQSTLKDIYEIELGFMPTFKKKQLKELPYVLWNSESEWISKVSEICKNEANKQRGCLIINEAIDHATRIHDKLLSINFPKKSLKLCTG